MLIVDIYLYLSIYVYKHHWENKTHYKENLFETLLYQQNTYILHNNDIKNRDKLIS